MNIALNEHLELKLPPGAASVILTPGEAFDLAEDLVRRGIRRAMIEEAGSVLLEEEGAPDGTA